MAEAVFTGSDAFLPFLHYRQITAGLHFPTEIDAVSPSDSYYIYREPKSRKTRLFQTAKGGNSYEGHVIRSHSKRYCKRSH